MKALCAALPLLMILPQSAMRVARITVSPPQTIAVLDLNTLKGEPVRLAWAADGAVLYVQTLERRKANQPGQARHYVLPADGGMVTQVQDEPAWASAYWIDKSAQTSPDDRAVKIELRTEERQERTTASPMGGDLARGGVEADTRASGGDAGLAGYREPASVHMMVLKGRTIGEFTNTAIVPGLTFGWGPRGSKAIAFTAVKGGRIVIMDAEGAIREVDGSKDALLPAWSPDGARLAWIEKDGRRRGVVKAAHVSSAS